LTAREIHIVELISAGLSNKDIARRLKIGVSTTKSHVHNLLGKLDVRQRGQAVVRIRDRLNLSAQLAGASKARSSPSLDAVNRP
jgi:DNA-binding NarL/FixJ family response regulator